jgi:serine/threonine protein kinase
MGQIFLAAAGELGGFEKLCVVKKVLPEKGDSAARRFIDEAMVVIRLNHVNLVQVFDAGVIDGEGYLAMELVEGKDLRAVWNRCASRRARIPLDVALYVMREVCRGLSYAHSYGELALVHRDISPPNILLSYHGDIKITDFGLAQSVLKREQTAPGMVLGRFSYLAPEQARGEPTDARTDLYAAGIVMWELLTGSQLFPTSGREPAKVLSSLRQPDIEPPSHRATHLSPTLDAITLRALAVDKAARYANAEQMRQALTTELGRLSPTMNAQRVGEWMQQLFADDRAAEKNEHERLLREELPRLRRELAELEPAAPVAVSATASTSRAPLTTRSQSGGSPAAAGSSTTDVAALASSAASAATGHGSKERRGVERPGAVEPSAQPCRPNDPIGSVLDERYRIDRCIGEGGMGRVYEAEHVQIGKRVAVKILHPIHSGDVDAVARFRREARAASATRHPNIIDVTDSGTTPDGSVYFVMELLTGIDLGALLDREERLAWPRAVGLAVQGCRALAAAHQAGIVHRDLKPENIFIVDGTLSGGPREMVKVLDFGIAKTLGLSGNGESPVLTQPGVAMGTPEYMAPEQATGVPVDARIDIYALGAIVYEMLVGVPPFSGENFLEVLSRKAAETPCPPRTVEPSLPEALDATVMMALARDPLERPQTMAELERQLLALTGSSPEGASAASATPIRGAAASPLRESDLFGDVLPQPSGSSPSPPLGILPATSKDSGNRADPVLAGSAEALPLPWQNDGGLGRESRGAGPSVAGPSATPGLRSGVRPPRARLLWPWALVPLAIAAAWWGQGALRGVLPGWLGSPQDSTSPRPRPPSPPKSASRPHAGAATHGGEPTKAGPAKPLPPPPPAKPSRSPGEVLLARARVAFRKGWLISPKGSNVRALLALAEQTAQEEPGIDAAVRQLRADVAARAVRQEAAIEAKNPRQAEKLLQEALEVNPADTRLRSALVDLLLDRSRAALADKKLEAAVAFATRAVEADGGRLDARLQAGEMLLRSKQYPLAAKQFRQVLSEKPTHKRAQEGLAEAEQRRPTGKRRAGR